tara:strand:+ start:9979 stop:10827 length:849 start_codon:yes stop_codon:yes gene_type:complete
MTQNFLSIYAKSFNWAGFFLPKRVYQNSSDLYDFCRTLDDIVDQNLKLELKVKNFKKFKDNFRNKNFEYLEIKKIYNLIENFAISQNIVLDLFDGVETDLREEVKFTSKKDLIIYSYRVAGTVGLMMAKILKVTSKDSLKAAIDLGIAMQLTNIARDVIEDKKRNRSYINPDFESIVQTLKLANSFYESSFNSIKDIPFKNRFGVLVARRVYREIGCKILKKKNMENYKKSGKIYVSNFAKINQTLLCIIDLIRLLFIKSTYHLRKDEHNLINEQINLNERI